MKINDFPLWHWHIENSSICSLRCPRCPRSEIPDTLVQTSLGLDFFEKNFTPDFLSDVWKISFCGDDGDPIYGKDFLDILFYLKFCKPDLSLRIVTNGSHRPRAWWDKLAAILNQYDEIHFSLDGWDQQSNEKYRVNSDWVSITDALDSMKSSSAVKTWAAIAFSFNYKKINTKMIPMAEALGFDKFQLTLSTKFGSKYANYLTNDVDSLEPSGKYVAKSHRFERLVYDLTGREMLQNKSYELNLYHFFKLENINNIAPICQIGNKGLYISSQGYFYPCCWLANRYNHTQWQEFRRPEFDLKERTITQVLSDPRWQEFFNNAHNYSECASKCAASNMTLEYGTSW
jgi:MoaA/NifB/PqqE/SkfB family radical SAM enzyme